MLVFTIALAYRTHHFLHLLDFTLLLSHELETPVVQVELFRHSDVVDDTCVTIVGGEEHTNLAHIIVGQSADARFLASQLKLCSRHLATLRWVKLRQVPVYQLPLVGNPCLNVLLLEPASLISFR